MSLERIGTFSDGSRLIVTTRCTGEAHFRCELYRLASSHPETLDLGESVYEIEAPTCREAQELTYEHASRFYGDDVMGMKKPPYLIWSPTPFPETRWSFRKRSR